MRKLLGAVAVVWLLVVPAGAVPYASGDLGFAAEFPASPTVGAPEDSEKDEAGNVLSRSVTVSCLEQGVYMAAAVVDTFLKPIKIDVQGSLVLERDNFIKGLEASLVSANPSTLDGHRAMFFTYERPDHSAAGSGVVVIEETDVPRIFVVVTMHTPAATDAQKSDLDAFLSSFHTKP